MQPDEMIKGVIVKGKLKSGMQTVVIGFALIVDYTFWVFY